jgi:pyroglutamyl-peptidase
MAIELLLTAFGPFGEFEENPTEVALKAFGAGAEVATHVFRTAVASVEEDLPRLFSELSPRAVVLFGYDDSASAVELETVARNASGETPDVDGRLLPAEIVVGGPPELPSTLPLARLESALLENGVHASYSDDAGGYLCNFSFYLAQSLAPRHQVVASGFVHLPSQARYSEAHGAPIDYLAAVAAVARAQLSILRTAVF